MTRRRVLLLAALLALTMPGVLATALLLVLGAPRDVVGVGALVVTALAALLLFVAVPLSREP